MSTNSDNENVPTLKELYPELSNDELKEAEENLRRYVAVVLRIHDRLERKQSNGRKNLTRENNDDAMTTERSD